MTRITIDRRKFLVKQTPEQICDLIRDAYFRSLPIILTTKSGIVSIPTPRLNDFVLTAEKIKK